MTPTGRSKAMHALKEKRIATIQAVVDRDFPELHSLSLERQAAAMRRAETEPEVLALDDEMRALRAKEEARRED